MVGMRKKSYSDDIIGPGGKEDGSEKKLKSSKEQLLPAMIKNKAKRSVVHAGLKHQKKLEKRKKAKACEAAEKRALEIGEEPPPKKIPRTIENTRESDETICEPDDEELFAGNDADEFSSILKQESTSKILITTCRFNSTIVEYAKKKDFTSIIVVHTNHHEPDAFLVICLPDGPTAYFKLSRLVLQKDIKIQIFVVGELKESKQSDSKGIKGKDAQDDKSAKKKIVARLQECGPRFTLKLISVQQGTFDTKSGEYEWVHKLLVLEWKPCSEGFFFGAGTRMWSDFRGQNFMFNACNLNGIADLMKKNQGSTDATLRIGIFQEAKLSGHGC
ncbi:unnamed protein product [Ilex paraguariensis]|uniref:Brix domain-containing protein n=1 Tax=Ilex paraguariensis TaxID=185542 RepID=A0ABC8TCE0_9AQUA